MSGRCRSCGAQIVWALLPSGRRMILDAEPVVGGNIAVRRVGSALHARVRTKGDTLGPDEKTGVSHFATCADAADHRRRKS